MTKHEMSDSDLMNSREIFWMRKNLGLREIVRDQRKCLMCDKMFRSMDTKKHRICKECKVRENYG